MLFIRAKINVNYENSPELERVYKISTFSIV